MVRIGALIVTMAILAACAAPEPPLSEAETEAGAALSARIADRFQGALLATLEETIARKGMVAAIAVCAEEAPRIGARITAESGADVWRVALRNRNPRGAPDLFERAVMEGWQDSPLEADGRPRVHAALVGSDGGQELRWMRAIPTAPRCLACHGDPTLIAPEVRDAIAARYPADRATGFQPGEMRGAFSIRWTPKALRAALARERASASGDRAAQSARRAETSQLAAGKRMPSGVAMAA